MVRNDAMASQASYHSHSFGKTKKNNKITALTKYVAFQPEQSSHNKHYFSAIVRFQTKHGRWKFLQILQSYNSD